MAGRHKPTYWLPAQAANSLAQLAFIERSLAHIMAGWAVRLPSFEAKLAFGMQMHRAMERATQLRNRVNGLCHAIASQATVPAGLRAVLKHVDGAQSPAKLLAGMYQFVYPRLIELYETHQRETDPDGDRASIELIRTFLLQLKDEKNEGFSLPPQIGRAEAKPWIQELEELWRARQTVEQVPLADALWNPIGRVPGAARPEGARFSQSGSLGLVPADPLRDPQGVGVFLHKELDEEFTTLELMARNSYEHPDMPWAFHRDMARQASDEARHAIMIMRLMHARGFRHGDFPLSTSSYDGLYEFAPCPAGGRQELLWRILIRQTFMEGLAIDNLAHEIERRRSVGQTDIAAVLEYILRDEVFHAQSGQRWSKELLGHDEKALLAAREDAMRFMTARAEAAREHFVMDNLDEAMGELAAVEAGKESRGGKSPDRPLNCIGRAQAGYSDDDIRQVISWGYATEDGS